MNPTQSNSVMADTKDPERAKFEAWALPILGDNPTWRESGNCELAWQAWQARGSAAAPAATESPDARDAQAEFLRMADVHFTGGPFDAVWWQARTLLTSPPQEKTVRQAVQDVETGRQRQDGKWGGPAHDDHHTTADFVQLIEDYAGWARTMAGMDSHKARRRLIQVAALAVAACEAIDRAAMAASMEPQA